MSHLHEKSIADLETLIENWMLALGAMSTPELISHCRVRIKEAEAILQAKRRERRIRQESRMKITSFGFGGD